MPTFGPTTMEYYSSKENTISMEKKFRSVDDAIDYIRNYGKGEVHKSDFGIFTLRTQEDQKKDEHVKDHFFVSETSEQKFQYTIEEFKHCAILKVASTFKHPMISAAIFGKLNQFIEHFTDTEKMKEFALGLAIQNNHWNITEYLINNHQIKKNPTYWAIRYDNLQILKILLELKFPLYENWLAYCVYYDSQNVVHELLINRKVQTKLPKEEYETDWLKNELVKNDNKTSQIVRQTLNIG